MRKSILFILLLAVAIGVYFLSFNHDKKEVENNNQNQNQKQEEKKEDIPKKEVEVYNCTITDREITNSGTNISYKVNVLYSFFVDQDKKITPKEYTSTMLFNNINDLNTIYNRIAIENPEKFKKDEANLTIINENPIILGGYETFDDTYLSNLAFNGYACVIEE